VNFLFLNNSWLAFTFYVKNIQRLNSYLRFPIPVHTEKKKRFCIRHGKIFFIFAEKINFQTGWALSCTPIFSRNSNIYNFMIVIESMLWMKFISSSTFCKHTCSLFCTWYILHCSMVGEISIVFKHTCFGFITVFIINLFHFVNANFRCKPCAHI
jgi:hypothetical protein